VKKGYSEYGDNLCPKAKSLFTRNLSAGCTRHAGKEKKIWEVRVGKGYREPALGVPGERAMRLRRE